MVSAVHRVLVTKPVQTKRERPVADRVKRCCLYAIVFWIPGIVTLVRYMLAYSIVGLVIVYEVLVSVMWGVGATFDAIRHRGADDSNET